MDAREAIPTDYLRRIASWQLARGASAGAQAIHLYPFGGMKRTFGWLSRIGNIAELAPLCLDSAAAAAAAGDV